jgi:hypothetical protein
MVKKRSQPICEMPDNQPKSGHKAVNDGKEKAES